tara:strand:+ start:491 stop:832 length:342 start_codon:yes stop_codon:yes gene_type:complete
LFIELATFNINELLTGTSVNNQELKVANTKRLSKTLLTAFFIISAYDLLSTEQLPSKDELMPLAVSTGGYVNKQIENSFVVDRAPIELNMSLSLEIDLGEKLNGLIRGFMSLR